MGKGMHIWKERFLLALKVVKYTAAHPWALRFVLFGKGKLRKADIQGSKSIKARIRELASLHDAEARGWTLIDTKNDHLLVFKNEKEKLIIVQPNPGVLGEDLTWWMPTHGNGTAIDIGGYFGETALLLARRGFEKVIVYEPVPENVQLIQENARINHLEDVIQVVNEAVSKDNGMIEIESTYPPNSAAFGIKTDNKNGPTYKIRVKSRSWHEVLKQCREEGAKLIKVDCEGCERWLCMCAPEELQGPTYWIVEAHSKEIRDRILRHLKKANYVLTKEVPVNGAFLLHFRRKDSNNTANVR